jgi:hypothetical protein
MKDDVDIYSEFDPPTFIAPVGLFVGFFVLFVGSKFSESSAPFFAALSVGVVSMLIGATWPLRNRKMLWILIILVSLFHIIFIILTPFPARVSYGIVFTPVVALDAFLCWKLIVAILKLTDPYYRRK